ncbi:MAG: hypothetical protein PVH12_07905 [Candidatus Bathyarchaeota archaeon]
MICWALEAAIYLGYASEVFGLLLHPTAVKSYRYYGSLIAFLYIGILRISSIVYFHTNKVRRAYGFI